MKFLDANGLAYYHNTAVKQKLEEGNLRTLNGQSLVGTGDIEIDAGGDIISSSDNSYGIVVPSTLASIDPTLTISGAAADAKAVGDAIANISTGGGGSSGTGADGYSPIANVVKEGSTATITITDKTGTTTASISDGPKGDTGPAGPAGSQGVSITNASINSYGYLIITLSNNTTINAGLAQGSGSGGSGTGPAGVGIQSIAKTSTSGLVDTYTITLTDGNTSTFTVTNGATGATGPQGPKGDSATFTATVENEVLILGG